MHEAMNRFIEGTLDDADLMLFVFDLTEELEDDNPVIGMLEQIGGAGAAGAEQARPG
jgi:GTPase Era involved in 16S rRNA processing